MDIIFLFQLWIPGAYRYFLEILIKILNVQVIGEMSFFFSLSTSCYSAVSSRTPIFKLCLLSLTLSFAVITILNKEMLLYPNAAIG